MEDLHFKIVSQSLNGMLSTHSEDEVVCTELGRSLVTVLVMSNKGSELRVEETCGPLCLSDI